MHSCKKYLAFLTLPPHQTLDTSGTIAPDERIDLRVLKIIDQAQGHLGYECFY